MTVLDEDSEDLEVNRLRHEACGNICYVKGSLDTYEGGLFDYVVMAGSLKMPYEAQINRAKSLLKPGGTLIVAVDNRLGLKYKSGVKPAAFPLSYLCRVFKKHLNKTPTEFINDIRIANAKLALEYTNRSILQICEEVGFDNTSHFYHLFKKDTDHRRPLRVSEDCRRL